TRFRYQASRALSLRLVVQYNDSREMVNYASGETWHDKAWDIDPMITYRISSFSVFYVGSTSDYYKVAAGDLTGDGAPNSTKMKLDSRQFFMKLQYLFQT
ncbi:MAG: hypothetical protein GY841_11540, partial [FCB group bacterium]|nr:hypothetical protein [FCB group bacterium]